MSASEVESATAQMASTTLNGHGPTTNGTNGTTNGNHPGPDIDQPVNGTNGEAHAANLVEGRRLYIGNLAYATTEGDLAKFFEGYLVDHITIPTNPRTSRPVGYAFVDLSAPTEAERAVVELNGKAILDRKVSIQIARKPETHGDSAADGVGGADGKVKRRRSSTRGRGRGRGRGGRSSRGGRPAKENGVSDNAVAAADPATSVPTNVPGQVAPLTETTNEALTAEKGADGTISINPAKVGKTHVLRERKHRGPPEDGVPSKTKIMVANLPYDLKEERLYELFRDYQPQAAKIALRPIPRFMVKKLQARNEPRKGRGFGFVTLASEEMQQKACHEMNGIDIAGREIAVKVAIDSPGKEDEALEAPIEGAPAAEEGAPSTAEGSASIAPVAAST